MEVEFMIRLDKFLSEMGVGTRQEVKQYIRKGKVEVDGEIAKRPELKVDETKAHVTLDGERIGYASYVYYMLNKPAGVVSATEDKREKTVIDLIKGQKRKDLFPVGRLDKDTVGLLLITNDGNLAHRLLSPKHHVDKCYFAKVQGNVTKDDAEKFAEGVNIGTEDELTNIASDRVHNDDEYAYLWREAVAAQRTTDSLSDWLNSIISEDGWCSVLNSWDGRYEEYKIAEEYICVCRS